MKVNSLRYTFAFLLVTLLSTVFVGCHSESAEEEHSVDSTKIKTIMDMQERGVRWRNSSDFYKAVTTHDSCIMMAEDIHDTIQLVAALNNQGTNYRRLGDMLEATENHMRALNLCQEYSRKDLWEARKNMTHSLNGLGNVAMTMGEYDAAEQEFRMALEDEKKMNSATGMAINYANIGSIKEHKGDLDSARVYYNLSMEKNREDNNVVGICLCYSYLGGLAEASGDYETAKKNFHDAYAIGRSTDDVWHWLTPCVSLATNFIKTNLPDSSLHYIEIGLETATRIHSNEHLAKLYGLRSQVRDILGEKGQALRDLQLSNTYDDSVRNENARTSVQNVRLAYEVSRRVAEVEKAEDHARDSRMARNMVIIIACLVVFALLAVLAMYQHVLRERKKTTEERDVFYRNITHQLRTPMTVVLGIIDQFKTRIPVNDTEALLAIEAAQRQGRNLLELMKTLIVASKEKRLENVDISDTVQFKAPEPTGEPVATPAYKETTVNRILIAEDNEDVALLMCNVLRNQGYNVYHAVDGLEALDMLKSEMPDLLITDIAMPRMDGLELMHHVREDETMNHLPIIVVSARVENHERLEGIEAGAEVYIGKPFIVDELLLVVKNTLRQRDLLRRKFRGEVTDTLVVENISNEEMNFVESVNKLIDENLSSGDVNGSFLAEKCCMSVSTLNRRMRNLTGMPVAVYIRSRRMSIAKRMLVETDKPISEIEWMCGFNTVGHFSRQFHQEFGCTPTAYRQQMQK